MPVPQHFHDVTSEEQSTPRAIFQKELCLTPARQHSIPWCILVHLCDVSKGGKKCVKTILKGVNIIRINEAITFPIVNPHHLDN